MTGARSPAIAAPQVKDEAKSTSVKKPVAQRSAKPSAARSSKKDAKDAPFAGGMSGLLRARRGVQADRPKKVAALLRAPAVIEVRLPLSGFRRSRRRPPDSRRGSPAPAAAELAQHRRLLLSSRFLGGDDHVERLAERDDGLDDHPHRRITRHVADELVVDLDVGEGEEQARSSS